MRHGAPPAGIDLPMDLERCRTGCRSYAEFVSIVLNTVVPLLPRGIDPRASFSGCYEGHGWASPDAATIRGERARLIRKLALKLVPLTGVNENLYSTFNAPRLHMQGHEAYVIKDECLSHSAYARNIRRWEAGTLPRKRKARLDFALVAACWFAGWSDRHGPLNLAQVRDGHAPSDLLIELEGAQDAGDAAIALWTYGERAYRESLDARRNTRTAAPGTP